MKTPAEIRTEKYLEMLDFLRSKHQAEFHTDHGWITWAAKQVNRSQGYLSQLLKGQKTVGENSIREAAKRLGMNESWFYEDTTKDSHVEPIDEHPMVKKLRESGDFPSWVIDAVPQHFHNRNGTYKFSALYSFCEDILEAGEPHLRAMESRIGPPKRSGK